MRTYLLTSQFRRNCPLVESTPGESDNSRANICRSIFKEIVRFVYEDLIRERSFPPLPINAVIFREIEEFQQLECTRIARHTRCTVHSNRVENRFYASTPSFFEPIIPSAARQRTSIGRISIKGKKEPVIRRVRLFPRLNADVGEGRRKEKEEKRREGVVAERRRRDKKEIGGIETATATTTTARRWQKRRSRRNDAPQRDSYRPMSGRSWLAGH